MISVAAPPHQAVRRRILPGLLLGPRDRPARQVRGPRLRRLPEDHVQAPRRPDARELGDPREPDRRERGRLPAPGDPPEDRRAGRLLPRLPGGREAPAIPGAVIITSDKAASASRPVPQPRRPRVPRDPRGARRAPRAGRPAPAPRAPRARGRRRTSGHRGARRSSSTRLDARQIVELFVTINAKHTRLNPSHLVSLAGRKLYPDRDQALAHDVIRSLNEDETSPLAGRDQDARASDAGAWPRLRLAEEIVDWLETRREDGRAARAERAARARGRRFFLNYVKALAQTLPARAWAGRKYSIKTGTAPRALHPSSSRT